MEGNWGNFSNSEIKEKGPKTKKLKTGRMSPRTVYGLVMRANQDNRLKEDVMNRCEPSWKISYKRNLMNFCGSLHVDNFYRSDNDISHQMNIIHEFVSNEEANKNINNESNSNCHNVSNSLNTKLNKDEDCLHEIDDIFYSQKNVELDVCTNTKVGKSSGSITENYCFEEDANIQENNISNTSVGSETSKNCNIKLSTENIIKASCDNDPFEAIVSNSQLIKSEENMSFTENDKLNLPGSFNTSNDIILNMEIKNSILLLRKLRQATILRNVISLVDELNEDVLKAIAAIRRN